MLIARRRAPRERDLTPLFEAFCSGTVGRVGGANIPSVRLSIYTDFLVVAFLTPHVIPFNELKRVEVSSGVFGRRRLHLRLDSGATYQLSVKSPETVAKLLHRT